jgi:hypothetical protein
MSFDRLEVKVISCLVSFEEQVNVEWNRLY